MHATTDAIFALWVAFWTYWFVASSKTKEARASSSSGTPTGVRATRFTGVRIAAILAFLLLLRAGVFKGSAGSASGPWSQGIGLAVFLSGLALAVWARVCIGGNWGMPMSRKADPELVTTGPYRRIRHPIYTGIILATVGTAIAINLYWFIAAALLSAYFIYSSYVEESNMEKALPEQYRAYKRSTKRMIPFIY